MKTYKKTEKFKITFESQILLDWLKWQKRVPGVDVVFLVSLNHFGAFVLCVDVVFLVSLNYFGAFVLCVVVVFLAVISHKCLLCT